jgi:hypothetical protein
MEKGKEQFSLIVNRYAESQLSSLLSYKMRFDKLVLSTLADL